jgi:protein-S-isoprenylcysteine O-methyltransferase Ste14
MRGLRVPVPWVFVLVYLMGVALENLLPLGVRETAPSATPLVGSVLFCLGAAFAGWGWWLFHKAGTTRVPGQASTTLVTSGPYRLTRNPMYVGLGVAYLGEAGILRHAWPILLLPLIGVYLNWVIVPVEEARLLEVFGRAYETYREKVRRWF